VRRLLPENRMPIRSSGLLALLTCALVAAPCPSTAIGAEALSLADAERVALDRDAMLREMRSQAASLRERAIAEGQLTDPKLRFGAVNVPTDSFSLKDEDMTMLEVGLSQEFKPGDSRKLSRRQAEQQASAMDAVASDRERVVRREVRKLWTQLGYAAAVRRVLREQTGWFEQLRQSARARYASGEGKQLDVLQAGLESAMLREQQLDLDRDEAMWRSQLSYWIGADQVASAEPQGVAPRSELLPLATLEARLDQHPTQVDFMQRIAAAHTALERAQELRKPGWMLDVSYGFRQDMLDGGARPDMLSAMVTLDLPLFRSNRQDREVGAARLDEQGLVDKHDDHRRDMQAMLDEAWNTARRTGELEQFYETELLPLAEQSVTAALLAWRSNRGMFEDVVTARRLSLQTRTKHVRLAADRALAQHEIDYLAGDAE
jgi:outer membrane protein TolC